MKLSDLPLSRIHRSINEVKMSPQRLINKAKLNKYNIQVGFESELVIPDGMAEYGSNPLSDYSDREIETISDVLDILDAAASYSVIGDRDARNYSSSIQEAFSDYVTEWQRGQFYEVAYEKVRDVYYNDVIDRDTEIRRKLEELGLSEEEIEESIENEDRNYQMAEQDFEEQLSYDVQYSIEHEDEYFWEAFNEFIDDLDDSDVNEHEFLESQSIYKGEDVFSHFGIDLDESEDNYDTAAAEHYAEQYADWMSIPSNEVNVLSSYHASSKEPGEWYFEPDSSIESNSSKDLHVEIVSPPMPVDEALDAIKDHFAWMKSVGAVTNDSTGLHISVSIQDDEKNENIDTLKLALFTGDSKILSSFGRQANSYCRNYFEKIRQYKDITENDIPTLLNKLKTDLSELANRILKNTPKDKYQSINPRSDYVEFRSLGNKDYHKKLEEIQAAVGRFAYAYAIASDPNMHREEYLKKLYKFINPAKGTDLDIFVRYAAGDLTVAELKREWAAAIVPSLSTTVNTDFAIVDKQQNKIVGYVHAAGQDGAEWSAYEKIIKRDQRQTIDLAKFLTKYSVEPVDKRRELKSKLGKDPSVPTDTGNLIVWDVISNFTGKKVGDVEATSKDDAARKFAERYRKSITDIQSNYSFERQQGDMFANRELDKRQQFAKKVGQMKNVTWQIFKLPDVNKVIGEVEAERNSRYGAEQAARKKLNIDYDTWKQEGYMVAPKLGK